MTENKNRFSMKYETKGVSVYLDGDLLCFLNKHTKDHTKLTSKRARFYKSLEDIGKEDVYNSELANELMNEIDKAFSDITKAKQTKQRELIEADESIDSWIKLAEVINRNLYNREEEFKFIMACVVSLWFRQNDFIFVLAVARRGEGKSTMLKAFNDSELTYSVDTFTANAFAPGEANIGDKRHSLLDECENRNLIVHDMSASLSLPTEVKLKILGDITNSYDESGLSKFSPGAGNRHFGGAYNFIGGITYRFLANNWKHISNTGRFLYYKMPELKFRDIVESKLVPNSKELNAAVKGFLKNLTNRYKELATNGNKIEFEIYPLGIDMMKDFFEVYEKYLQVRWDKDEKELTYDTDYHVENPNRRYRQAIMLLKAMALLEGRTKINFGDFKEIKQVFLGIDSRSEVRKKLKLIDEFDLPNFHGKKWSLLSLFGVESNKEFKKRMDKEFAEQPDHTEEPELQHDYYDNPEYIEELRSAEEIQYDNYIKKHGEQENEIQETN